VKELLKQLIDGKDLTQTQAETGMQQIMSGEATPAQIAAFLTALRIKGETIAEITGCAKVMREHATTIPHQGAVVVDTCGTGGDMKHTFNISTITALVAAGAGAKIAKHGNRAVSSQCGSADLLKALGVNIQLEPDMLGRCIDEVGIGFLFAPLLHQAMKYAIGPRRELGFRTIFNILGPLTNPAGAQAQLLGVYSVGLTSVMASVLEKLGSRHALVVHGEDGLDEITTTARTKISEYKAGQLNTYYITPEKFGIPRAKLKDLMGEGPEENAKIALSILKGATGPKRDVVLLNAAATLLAADMADDIPHGLEMAKESIDSGAALNKLEQLIEFSNA
jgi:anthranilate phosphoribosyltransferase